LGHPVHALKQLVYERLWSFSFHPLFFGPPFSGPAYSGLRNDIYCVGWGVKLYSLIPAISGPAFSVDPEGPLMSFALYNPYHTNTAHEQ